MKLVTQSDDTVLYMRTLYTAAEEAAEYMKTSKLSEIRDKKPKYTAKDTPETKKEKMLTQSKKNMAEMLRVLMLDYPEGAIEIAKKFIILDEGEEMPTGALMFNYMIKVFTDAEVLDFFTLQLQLAQELAKD